MRRSGSSALKAEGERFLVGPPKRFLDVKLERTDGAEDEHGAEGKAKLLGESAAAAFRDILVKRRCERFLLSSDGLERMKTELREDVSGQSSSSDMESDSDTPTEVDMRLARVRAAGSTVSRLTLAGQSLVFILRGRLGQFSGGGQALVPAERLRTHHPAGPGGPETQAQRQTTQTVSARARARARA